jgi:hypothetical protein
MLTSVRHGCIRRTVLDNHEPPTASEWWTTGDVAKAAGVTNACVDVWVRVGKLTPDATTPGRLRLFRSTTVLAFLALRAAKGAAA